MKYIQTILFVALTSIIFARGGSGTYYIKGIAYGTDNKILKNIDLTVLIGDSVKVFKTNDNGQFEISVYWEAACSSGSGNEQVKKANEGLNPKFIFVKYMDKELKIDNEWEKYAKTFPATKDETTCKKDIRFTNK